MFHSRIAADAGAQRARAVMLLEKVLALPEIDGRAPVWRLALEALRREGSLFYSIIPMVADEMSRVDDSQLPRYLYHRYRYEVYPAQKVLDEYPPYLQIEPSSICNYRCAFCYQTNKDLSGRESVHMGKMPLGVFRQIIDQVDGHVDFLSLASRGEPLVCDDIDSMLTYCSGKFLGLKVNTNGSLLNEAHCHALLAGGVNTVVFSVDAADAALYRKMRTPGIFEKVEENIRLFEKVRKVHYSKSRIITRISGVKFTPEQDMGTMISFWGDVVDQICFVNYNPWENVYKAEVNGLEKPCSDLWRRMFIWFDGKANPCDVDYLSSLSLGAFPGVSVRGLWESQGYRRLRQMHNMLSRGACEPCRRCSLV